MLEFLVGALVLFTFYSFLSLRTLGARLVLLEKQLIKHIETDKYELNNNVIQFNNRRDS